MPWNWDRVREGPLVGTPSTAQEMGGAATLIPPGSSEKASDAEVVTPQLQSDGGSAPDRRPDVLVVEDDEDEVRIIQRAIRKSGLESRFKILPTGEDALEYLRTSASSESERRPNMPKLVMLDLKLSGIGGQEVLRQIREDERLHNLPIVIVSSSRSERDVRDCYRLGANSFVRKHRGYGSPGEHVLVIARYWLDFNQPALSS
jgi:two-component system, response regulator